MRRTCWVVLALGIGGLVGCSSETIISKSKAEAFVNDNLNPKPKSVVCPDGVKAKANTTLDCQVAYDDGDKGTVTVHIVDDKGNVRVNPEDLHIQK